MVKPYEKRYFTIGYFSTLKTSRGGQVAYEVVYEVQD
jgi:hypothetical protein